MMMMMMMMMTCFCGMVDRWKVFRFFSSRDHCQRSSPLQIPNTLWAGFEPPQNLSYGFVDWSSAVVITPTPRRHKFTPKRSKFCLKLNINIIKWVVIPPLKTIAVAATFSYAIQRESSYFYSITLNQTTTV